MSLPFKCYKCKNSEHHAAVCPSSKNFAGKSSKHSINCQSNPGANYLSDPGVLSLLGGERVEPNLCFCLDSGAQFSSFCKEAVEKYVDERRSPPMARLLCSYG